MPELYEKYTIDRSDTLDNLAGALDLMMNTYDYESLTNVESVRIMRICDSISDLETMIRTD